MRSARAAGVRYTAIAAASVLALSACGSGSDDETSQSSESTTQDEGQEEEPDVQMTAEETDSDTTPGPLTEITVEEGEDSETVVLEFDGDAPEYEWDRFVAPVYFTAGDFPDEPIEVDGDWFLRFTLTEGHGLDTDAPEEAKFDGAVAHVKPFGRFEGTIELVIGIESEYGEQPGYEITTDGSQIHIEITEVTDPRVQ
ncbi:hypothetical protein [Streptomyces spiramenti]|uniref:Lipoprotein n=1 Tax=Streptomyces spiramenti TaxID=2720606 RepID=A0ABX1AHI1_9ACTN|nr:hypothetical protein [Streptomyces spiramenti]NJP66599.1 hypothetical protein [Streptomyces spiramenti]